MTKASVPRENSTDALFAKNFLAGEVIVHFVVVEGQTFGAAELGEDLHDILLLTGREGMLAVMVTVIGAFAAAEISHDTTAGLGLQIAGDVVVEMAEAPGFLHWLVLTEVLALSALPCRRIDGWAVDFPVRLKQVGMIMQALIAQLTVFIETDSVFTWNIFQI